MALSVQIQKRLGDFFLDVDFSAEAGELFALLGASGCGKSMTLNCIAGVERPDRGRIELDGRTLFDSERRINLPPQRRRIGYLFQQYALFPHMTVAQNIAAGASRADRGRAAALIAAMGLQSVRDLRPRELSGGQQQRTALARCLASQPEALLLDEPFSALDGFLRWQLELELREVLDRFGGPILWVSHDRGEVYRNCSRVCVLERGKSAPARAVRDLMADPGTVSAARISGCKNYAPVRPGPGPGTVSVPAWGLTLQAAAPWRRGVTTLGIRRVRPGEEGERNAFLCRTVRSVEDVSVQLAALCPEGSEAGAPLLWMELEKGVPLPDRLWAAVEPEDLLLLEG